jgi:hypothetical protein
VSDDHVRLSEPIVESELCAVCAQKVLLGVKHVEDVFVRVVDQASFDSKKGWKSVLAVARGEDWPVVIVGDMRTGKE